jgi:hypothetical protein
VELSNIYRILAWKSQGERHRLRWEDNIKMDLTEGMDRTELTQ